MIYTYCIKESTKFEPKDILCIFVTKRKFVISPDSSSETIRSSNNLHSGSDHFIFLFTNILNNLKPIFLKPQLIYSMFI